MYSTSMCVHPDCANCLFYMIFLYVSSRRERHSVRHLSDPGSRSHTPRGAADWPQGQLVHAGSGDRQQRQCQQLDGDPATLQVLRPCCRVCGSREQMNWVLGVYLALEQQQKKRFHQIHNIIYYLLLSLRLCLRLLLLLFLLFIIYLILVVLICH